MYDFRGIKTFYKILLESNERCLQEDRISLTCSLYLESCAVVVNFKIKLM